MPQYRRAAAACVVLSAAVQCLGVTVRLAESREAALTNAQVCRDAAQGNTSAYVSMHRVGTQVGFGAAHDFVHDGTMPYWPDWPTTPLWAREAESIEVVRMGWNSVCTGPKTVDTARLERTLANVAARGKQAVLRVFGYDWDVCAPWSPRHLPTPTPHTGRQLHQMAGPSRPFLRTVLPPHPVQGLLAERLALCPRLGRRGDPVGG